MAHQIYVVTQPQLPSAHRDKPTDPTMHNANALLAVCRIQYIMNTC